MGFLDNIKNRLHRDDDYYDDDEYYDDEYDDQDAPRDRGYGQPRPTSSATKLLGNTSRPEAESVSVYTRSGRPVSQNGGSDYDRGQDMPSRASQSGWQDDGYSGGYTPSSSSYGQPTSGSSYTAPTYDASYSTSVGTPTASEPKTSSRVTSGQLPAYVLRPVSYEDVQSVVRRVRTNQPVILIFKGTNIETAKRILDFCYGLSFGIGGEVQALGDRVFAVLPKGIQLSQTDIDKLVNDGDLER